MSNKATAIIIVLVVLVGGYLLFTAKEPSLEEGTQGTTTSQQQTEQQQEEPLVEMFGKIEQLSGYSYELKVTQPGDEGPIENVQKVWAEDDKMRMELTAQGQKIIYLMDAVEQVAYTYVPSQNIASKISLDSPQGEELQGVSPSEQAEAVIEREPVIKGTEVLNGKECLVVDFTSNGAEGTTWVWKKHGLPIKIESRGPEGTTVVEMQNIEIKDIEDELFQIPPGVQIIEEGQYGQ